ncbi:MAG TPA: DUF262 domain-containing protein [Xanthobacteraceae bacterium]|nr:DUF262 domain-containing protein [Xanthobacteraceae bacterium]
MASSDDLTVKGESIERVYGQYNDRRYVVNRRYQRKLIWTLDEKISFIDSIVRGYPVPIILLAENRSRGDSYLEIIDGMQRINAITSFIENDYAVDSCYFDLNTMAITKAKLDRGEIGQKTPIMDRQKCVRIASYLVPFSIFEFSEGSSVDEVFRRINSGGRKLSRQELRAAGATGQFAQVVRQIAAKIRGDDSHSDVLRLNEMKNISITNKDLAYGIAVDELFWVKQGILTKEQVRESRDEELLADIIAYMVSDPPPSSRAEFLDDFFSPGDDQASQTRFEEIERAIQKRTAEITIIDFQRAFDQLRLTLDASGKTFGQLLFDEQPARAPRYFQAVLLAFYELTIRKSKEVKDRSSLVKRMDNGAKGIAVPEGGRWGAEQRQTAVHALVGVYGPFFGDATAQDPALVHWITQLENILSQSYTEQSAYDFKQGLLRLDDKSFDEDSFAKILQTCVGIANLEKGARGYVLVGVADTSATAIRVEKLFGISARAFDRFFVVGVEHEAQQMGKTLDQLFQMIVEKIKASKVSAPLRDHICKHLKLVRYYDKSILVFEIKGQDDPSNYDGEYFIRNGAQVNKIASADLATFVRQYIGA